MTTTPTIGWDTETHRIKQEQQCPRVVCLTFSLDDETEIIPNDDWENLHAIFACTIHDRGTTYVAHNNAYDLSVIAANFPDLIPAIFDALADGIFSCTMIREKLLCLATTGDLSFRTNPDGSKSNLRFDLATLVMNYFGVDISADKTASDSYRLYYGELFDGKPLSAYPKEAIDYAISDAVWAAKVWQVQEQRRIKLISERNIDPFKVEAFRVYLDFCLKLMSSWGACADPDSVLAVEAMLAKELTPDRLNLLVESGILRPAQPPRPHVKAKEHVEGCKKKDCACPPRMTQGVEESIDKGKLKDFVLAMAAHANKCLGCKGSGIDLSHPDHEEKNGPVCFDCGGSGETPSGSKIIKLKYTDKTDRFPNGQLQVDKDFLTDYAHLDPVLEQYQHRQALDKLVNTEVPRMKLNGQLVRTVHPQYNCLVESGRTSSFSGKSTDYASFNCQNVDPRMRGAFVARPGYVLFSIDFATMELGTLAQTCFNLFGYSVMKDKINAGIDLHAYFGAQLAQAMDPDFQGVLRVEKATTRDEFYDIFSQWTNGDTFKKYRKMAKPVNFGYPGGLGPDTFIAFAKSPYGVIVDRDTAIQLRALWKETFPEMVEYLKHINTLVDPWNVGVSKNDDGEMQEYETYHYDTPMGLHRAGCGYCAAANGLGVQSPAAEGSELALINVTRACYDWSLGSILGPCADGPTTRPWGFIHDEFMGEVKDDGLAHERMMEMRQIMIAAMQTITPDVKADAKPALMLRWNKAAEPVYDANGRLTIWRPSE